MKIKHFENLWEEAEKVSVDFIAQSLAQDFDSLRVHLKDLESEPNNFSFGKTLFFLCAIAQKLNINSYTALVEAISDIKQEAMEG